MPQDPDTSLYDKIGQDETRILHREPAKFWVEVIVRPVYHLITDRNSPSPKILQAPAPGAIIGGNHAGADLLAQLVIDKYVYHLPEYRQVKQYADLKQPDVTLPGCMAHVRRKFTDAQASHPYHAQQAIEYIQLLYELEANLKARKASP